MGLRSGDLGGTWHNVIRLSRCAFWLNLDFMKPSLSHKMRHGVEDLRCRNLNIAALTLPVVIPSTHSSFVSFFFVFSQEQHLEKDPYGQD
mgnify:CR=1 FL=1